MILTCPACSTRYDAGAAKIGPEGKMVRCAACRHTWRAFPEPPPPPIVEDEPEPDETDLIAELIEPETLPARTPEPPPPPLLGAEPVVSARRGRWFAASVWGSAAACLIALVIVGYVFRVEIVRAAPGLAGMYALVGVQASERGIVFEGLAANRRSVEGRTMLTVTATFTNPTGRARPVPPVRVSLRDRSGEEVYSQVARAAASELAAGGSMQFGLVIDGPPEDAEDLELTFVDVDEVAQP